MTQSKKGSGKGMPQDWLLLLGIGSTGFCIGYLTGGSASSAAAGTIAAVFGLIASGLAVLQRNSLTTELTQLNTALRSTPMDQLTDPKVKQDFDKLKDQISSAMRMGRKVPETLGGALVAFSILFLVGAHLGGMARAERWYDPPNKSISKFPWDGPSAEKPKSVGDAVNWLQLQLQMVDRGYPEDKVKELYETLPNKLFPTVQDKKGGDSVALGKLPGELTLPSRIGSEPANVKEDAKISAQSPPLAK